MHHKKRVVSFDLMFIGVSKLGFRLCTVHSHIIHVKSIPAKDHPSTSGTLDDRQGIKGNVSCLLF